MASISGARSTIICRLAEGVCQGFEIKIFTLDPVRLEKLWLQPKLSFYYLFSLTPNVQAKKSGMCTDCSFFLLI